VDGFLRLGDEIMRHVPKARGNSIAAEVMESTVDFPDVVWSGPPGGRQAI